MSKPEFPLWAKAQEAGQIVVPPLAKINTGHNAGQPTAAEYMNWHQNNVGLWIVGMQHTYANIVVGSSAQVSLGEATNTVDDFVAAIVAGDTVAFIGGQTHTLTRIEEITENDVTLIFERTAILADGGFTLELSGARIKVIDVRLSGFGTNDMILSGASGRLFSSGGSSAIFNITGSWYVEDDGDIILPNISDFTNSQHNHSNAAGGAQINSNGIVAGAIDLAHMSVNSIDSDQYVDDSIDSAHYNLGSVDQLAVLSGAGGTGAIGQAELKTGNGTISTSTVGVLITLPGGLFGFWTRYKTSNTSSNRYTVVQRTSEDTQGVLFSAGASASFLQTCQLGGPGAGITVTADQTYIIGSPPYDLGNGVVPLFMFVVMLPDGTVESTYIALDPPWANNGPTNIRGNFVKNGRPMNRQRVLPPAVKTVDADGDPVPLGKVDFDARMDALRNPVYNEVEINQALKQADMPLIPHPFFLNELPGRTVILLEPTGEICADLCALHEEGVAVSDLLHEGYLEIGNDALDVIAPPDVMPVSLKWKNTG